MPRYIIEREIPGAGNLSVEELQALSQKADRSVKELDSKIQWLHSFVADDKIYCVYIAPDEEILRRHSKLAGFPTNRVSRIKSVIDPTTAESAR